MKHLFALLVLWAGFALTSCAQAPLQRPYAYATILEDLQAIHSQAGLSEERFRMLYYYLGWAKDEDKPLEGIAFQQLLAQAEYLRAHPLAKPVELTAPLATATALRADRLRQLRRTGTVRLPASHDPLDRLYAPGTASADLLAIATGGEIDSLERRQLAEFARHARPIYQQAQAAATATQPNPFAGLPYEELLYNKQELLAERQAAKIMREPQPTADIDRATLEVTARRQQMRRVASLVPIENGYRYDKATGKEYIYLQLAIKNHTHKQIQAMGGLLELTDGQQTKKPVRSTYYFHSATDKALAGDSLNIITLLFDYDSPLTTDRQFRYRDLGPLAVRWKPDSVRFADGLLMLSDFKTLFLYAPLTARDGPLPRPLPAPKVDKLLSGPVYDYAERMPELPNGGSGPVGMEEAVRQLLPFPGEAARASAHGIVGVQFVVSATGQVSGARITKSLSTDLDTAALRAVRKLPVLRPGQHLDKPVAVRYTLLLHLPTNPANPPAEGEYTFIEHPPTLPGGGGQEAIIAAVQQRVVMPATARSGIVFVAFTTYPTGAVGRAYILRGQSPAVDDAVLAAVRQLPALTPGVQNGRTVAYRFTLPIQILPPNSAASKR